MAISTTTKNICHQPIQFSALGPDIGIEIFKKVMLSGEEEAGQNCLSLILEEAARTCTHAMTNLHSVSKEFRNWALQTRNLHKDVGMAATGNAIKDIADLDNVTFRERIASRLNENEHIRVDFSLLSSDQGRIVLEELSRDTISPLRHVDMNMAGSDISMQEVIDVLGHMSSHHPDLHIDLDLNSKGINTEEAKALAAVLPESKVTNLNLALNNIGDEGAIFLAVALPQSKLSGLNLSANKINQKGARNIAAMLSKSALTKLDLCSNNIGDEGATFLAVALPRSKLTDLNLSNINLSQEGARNIAAMLSKSVLTKLDLCANDIRDEGVTALAEALSRSKVTELLLNGNAIGEI